MTLLMMGTYAYQGGDVGPVLAMVDRVSCDAEPPVAECGPLHPHARKLGYPPLLTAKLRCRKDPRGRIALSSSRREPMCRNLGRLQTIWQGKRFCLQSV